MTSTETSFCRLCTALCPIVVTIEDGRAVAVHGDREAPLFGGYTCPKGRALPEIHSSPERLLHSLKKRPDGSHERISSEQLVVEVADHLSEIVDRHGPRSVAMYTGTSNIAYPTMGGMAAAMLRALGSTMFFSAATIDQPGIMIADAVHGLWLGGRNRLEDADVWLFVGTNPVVSKQFIGENPARQLHRAIDRGMKLVVIDPRRTETARLAHIHLQPRPNEDATLVAAILHVLLRDGFVDEPFVRDERGRPRGSSPGSGAVHARVRGAASRRSARGSVGGGARHRHGAPGWYRRRHRREHDQPQQPRLVPPAVHQLRERLLGTSGRSGRATERAPTAEPRQGAGVSADSSLGTRYEVAGARPRADRRRPPHRRAGGGDPDAG